MADDEMTDPEDELDETVVDEPEEADPDLDPDELDEEALEADDEFAVDDEFAEADEAEDEEEAEDDTEGPVRRAVATEDDDDDDMIAPDDVEADLDTILKDRLVAADDDADEEDEEPEERGEAADRLQPKRSDEQLCPNCFLLIRNGAPTCPIGDDECPIIPSRR